MTTPAQINQLNTECYCFSLDRESVHQDITDRHFAVGGFLDSESTFFAGTGILLDRGDIAAMHGVIDAIETLAKNTAYRADKLQQHSLDNRWVQHSGNGALMGYDFHISRPLANSEKSNNELQQGPQLIEVNTNAGGAFLVGELHRACDKIISPCCGFQSVDDNLQNLYSLIDSEWRSAGREGKPKMVAIVDDSPATQYLYPDMLIAKDYFEEQGINTIVADVSSLDFSGSTLTCDGIEVDFVYNRCTDFALSAKRCRALKDAALSGAAVVAPNPLHHALYANKRNLLEFRDNEKLLSYGLTAAQRAHLSQHVPESWLLTEDNAEELHASRKTLFFKPVDGYGSKAVYRGDKITRRVWNELLDAVRRGEGYLAQKTIAPQKRAIVTKGRREQLKYDVRVYTAGGAPLLTVARAYQGQTTNFRSAGGGFAPVYYWSDSFQANGEPCNIQLFGNQ